MVSEANGTYKLSFEAYIESYEHRYLKLQYIIT